MSASPPRLIIDNDTPQRLGGGPAQFGLTAAAVRPETKRGRLVIYRVAGKDWTSVAEVQRMFGLCRSAPRESDSGFDRPVETSALRGLSEKVRSRSALDALSLSLSRLRESSPTTSHDGISPTGRAARRRRSA